MALAAVAVAVPVITGQQRPDGVQEIFFRPGTGLHEGDARRGMRYEHRAQAVAPTRTELFHLSREVDYGSPRGVEPQFEGFHRVISSRRRSKSRQCAATVDRVPTLPTVLVARQSDGNFTVRVRNGKSETSHVVAVPSELETELGLESTSTEALVRASFAFLLDREPASSILPKFSLDVISRYFPEYRREIQSYL